MTSGDEFTHSEFSHNLSGLPLGLEAELAQVDQEAAEQRAMDTAIRTTEDRIYTLLDERGFDMQHLTAMRTQYPDYAAVELCGEAEQLMENLIPLVERFKREGHLLIAIGLAEQLEVVRNTIANLAILSHLSAEMRIMAYPECRTGDEKTELQAKVFADETLTPEQQNVWFLVIDELIEGEGLDMSDPQSVIRIERTAGELHDASESSRMREEYVERMRPILQEVFARFRVVPHDQLESMSTALFSAALREHAWSLQKEALIAGELQILRKRAAMIGWDEERLQQVLQGFQAAVHDAHIFDAPQ